MFRQYRLRNYDFKLIICVLALSIIGILAVGSAEESLRDKQLMGMLAGVILMLALSFVDYSIILHFNWVIYLINLILLLAVLLVGIEVNGAKRWINIAGIQFQPSEIAKILLILFFAQFIMKYKDKINTIRFISSSIILVLIPIGLIYQEPDLSTSIMISIAFCVMIFIGGLSYRIVIGIFAVIIPSFITFMVLILRPDQNLLQDYQLTRILAWLQPDKYADTAAYQSTYSKIAIGSGMLWGKGLNNDDISSVKNGNFIAEPETDFIYAVIGEEMGFVGACSVIVLLLVIVICCLIIARKSKDLAGRIIATGLAAIIGFQGFINIAVATALFPNTGIPLPFVSSGLTSLISLYIGIGIVLNIGLQPKKL